MTTITEQTPVAMLTVGQLREALNIQEPAITIPQDTDKEREYVYGIRGIRNLFNVSHVTACKYKAGILRDAVIQRGRVIVTDVEKARELFNDNQR